VDERRSGTDVYAVAVGQLVAKTQQGLEDLCNLLERNNGDLLDACHRLGVTVGWVKRWRKEDPAVAVALDDAMDSGVAGLENEAIRRAVKGTPREIYHKGLVVGEEQVYSDALLTLLLKGRRKQVYGTTDVNVNTSISIQTMSDAEIEQRIAALTAAAALLPPIEGEFVEVMSETAPDPDISLEDLL
jgi:hypothetical protein